MSRAGKRVLITALIAIVLATVVMGFEIWKGYAACAEGNLDSYVVSAMSFQIYSIAKNGASYVGTPEPLNIFFIYMIYLTVLITINEVSHSSRLK